MQIQLRVDYDGAVSRFCKPEGPVTIGRSSNQVTMDLDLSEDASVARMHARIWFEDGEFWIEDSGSMGGTWIGDKNIKGQGRKRLGFNQPVRIDHTTIQLESPDQLAEPAPRPSPPDVEDLKELSDFTFVERLDADQSGVISGAMRGTALESQLNLLCELALKLGAEPQLNRLLQMGVKGTVDIIPGAKSGALLMIDRGSGRLMLKAHLPADYRPSERLARQAIETREGFAWVRGTVGEVTDYLAIGNGMCVPLVAGQEAIGALCVEVPASQPAFKESDLRVLRAIGQFISMAIEQHQARAALARQSEFTNRLFSSRFPEKVRNALLTNAAEGTLPIGTRRSMVTVLQADIRGFTRLSEELGPHRVSDLLNAYFPPLVEQIFAFGGSVERLVGDAIFAVFGSPEADHEQQAHAVYAALAMQQAAAEVSAFRLKRNKATCGIGIGIDCGEVLHGFIGNAESIDFTVIGDAANYASRYCAGAKAGEILISSNVHSHVWKQVESEARTVASKHEGEIEAHLIKGRRARPEPERTGP